MRVRRFYRLPADPARAAAGMLRARKPVAVVQSQTLMRGERVAMAEMRKDGNILVMLVGLPWWGSLIIGAVLFVVLGAFVPAVFDGSPAFAVVEKLCRILAWIVLLLFAGLGLAALMRASVIARYKRSVGNVSKVRETATPVLPPLAKVSVTHEEDYAPVPPAVRPEVKAWTLEALRWLEWKRFELLAARYYEAVGFRAETVAAGADGGIDVKLFKSDPHKPLAIVQCKAWNARSVGVKELRELLGVMAHEKVGRGIFITSGVFSADAHAFGAANPIQMLDGPAFLKKITDLPPERSLALLSYAFDGDYTTPTCASCGIKMVRRASKRGEFWGCTNYPRCKSVFNIKGGAAAS
jgi:restriction system protein